MSCLRVTVRKKLFATSQRQPFYMTLIHSCDVGYPQNVGIFYGNNKTLPQELNLILIFVTTLVIPVSARINMGA